MSMRGRALPLLGVAALAGVIYSQTAGGSQQPNSRAANPPEKQSSVSESLQAAAGTGGKASRDGAPEVDPKDTRLHSRNPTAESKRSSQKTTDD
jgi:hypothetical protein